MTTLMVSVIPLTVSRKAVGLIIEGPDLRRVDTQGVDLETRNLGDEMKLHSPDHASLVEPWKGSNAWHGGGVEAISE